MIESELKHSKLDKAYSPYRVLHEGLSFSLKFLQKSYGYLVSLILIIHIFYLAYHIRLLKSIYTTNEQFNIIYEIYEMARLLERDLGYRKIQSTGRGAFIISLPKEWVQDIGLNKGNELAYKIQQDSTLILTPRKIMEGRKETEKPILREYKILVEPNADPQSISRQIIALYEVSADLIHLHFKDSENTTAYSGEIRNLVRNALLGSEIIDESNSQITIQILINHTEFPIEQAIRRMAILALAANRDAILSLNSMEDVLIQNVIRGCDDVNRLNLYVIRQLKFGLELNLFKEYEFKTPKEFLGYRIVSNDIKNIADNALNVTQNLIALKKLIEDQTLFLKEPVDEEVNSQIFKFNSSASQLFEESLKALFKRDYELADKIMSRIESLSNLENDLTTLMLSKRMDPKLSSILRLIFDSSRRVLDYSRDVAEVTLNRTVEEISQ
ncbi:MAG: Phosphate uptake regulator PhoU [Thermoproteota archaeon]|nr:Phosphate uptake regulator PhoU [Thermoproteota archaeon]